MKNVFKHNPKKDAEKCYALIHLSLLGTVKT